MAVSGAPRRRPRCLPEVQLGSTRLPTSHASRYWHLPPTQVVPDGQGMLHFEQCAELVCRLVSQPSSAMWLQSPQPALHRRMAQRPAAQSGAALATTQGARGAASAVRRIVVDIDFAAVVRDAVTIPVASQAARDGAEPVVAVCGRLRERAGDAGLARASGSRVRLGYALVVAELLSRGTLPIL